MLISDKMVDLSLAFLPTLVTLVVCGGFLWGCNWVLLVRRPELGNERKFPLQILMLVLTIVSVLAVVISLPIDEGSRNQLIGLIGILLSGIIAFSSTNVIANLMSGVLLRITKPFRTGDFIRVGEFFGRVSERGLFDTEIQSENRELIALPNAYLVNNPVSTIRTSGAIVSATLSLGYDVHHMQIEPLLIQAAEESGLKDPYVHILELGDYSITYRISALLTEVKGLLTARSNLFRAVLDTLHGQGIEIVSPAFMNQHQISSGQKTIPSSFQATPKDRAVINEAAVAEEMVFDKAERAEQIEGEKTKLVEDIELLEAALKEAPEEKRGKIKEHLELKREHLKMTEKTETSLSIEDIVTIDNKK